MQLNLKIIIDSFRCTQSETAISDWLFLAANQHGRFAVDVFDLETCDLPRRDARQYDGAQTERWETAVATADAFIFLVPADRACPPPALLNAIGCNGVEWIWGNKPAGVVMYGGGPREMGSAHILQQVLRSMGAHNIDEVLSMPFSEGYYAHAEFAPSELTAWHFRRMLDETYKWASLLKLLRVHEAECAASDVDA